MGVSAKKCLPIAYVFRYTTLLYSSGINEQNSCVFQNQDTHSVYVFEMNTLRLCLSRNIYSRYASQDKCHCVVSWDK